MDTMRTLLENPLVLLVLACEVGFWVVLAAGLIARYLLHRRRLSTILLVSVPLIDLVLVSVSIASVASGSPPEAVHGLAAVYLGFTVAFGHSIVRWADAHAAYRFGDGPKPVEPPKDGLAGLLHETKELGRAAVAAVIALGVIATLSTVAGTGLVPPAQWPGDPLWGWALRVVIVLGAWVVFGPVWVLLGSGGRSRETQGARHEHDDRTVPTGPGDPGEPMSSASSGAPRAGHRSESSRGSNGGRSPYRSNMSR